MGRLILAGILGGIAMFIWTSIAHMVLPLGEVGVRELPNEAAVLEALKTNLGENRGLYVYPGLGVGENPTPEAKKEAMKTMPERVANNPSGLLMYNPHRAINIGKLLVREFAVEVLEALLIVFLLAQTRLDTFVGRVGFVTVGGILAAIATNVSYWNWYGFPKRYTAAYILIQVVGFFVTGFVAALVMGRRANSA